MPFNYITNKVILSGIGEFEVTQLDKKLFIQAIVKYFLGIILFSALLFIPAGTLNYWNARLLIEVLFIPMFIVGIVLAIKNRELLRKRLNAKEKEAEQIY